ncbi:hypothetical protein ACFPK1_06950 [Actinomycetospora rhizophila]|uniref:Uncharacterized protein n=1 Tax=Actinomycetospora rhizophila TaxID=1416876 RepID=A0ABV9Z8N5_9PSEU
MLGDIAGTAPLRDALTTTNTLLEQVLEELRRVNADGLVTVAQELRAIQGALPAPDEA